MTALLIVLIPLLLLFFMFAMQSIESSLLSVPGTEAEVSTAILPVVPTRTEEFPATITAA